MRQYFGKSYLLFLEPLIAPVEVLSSFMNFSSCMSD